MIVVAEDTGLLLVTQPDHAHFAAELLSLWRTGGLPLHPRRNDLIFAAREHDNGWREADAAPRWDAESGRPHDFLTLAAGERIEIWERGACRFAAERPYAALLITRHALSLCRHRQGVEAWDRFLAFLRSLEESLVDATGVSPEELAADYRWIDLADLISLAACSRWREPVERHGVSIAPGAGGVHLEPFPLAGTTTFRVPCRWIPRRTFRSDADLGGELAGARWQEMSVRLTEVSSEP